jgi:hypothetical protein
MYLEMEREKIMSSDPPQMGALILLASLSFAELRQKVVVLMPFSEFSTGFENLPAKEF